MPLPEPYRWIARYYDLKEFAELKEYGLSIGFRWVESAPLVRSSYHAAEQVRALSLVHRKLYGNPSGNVGVEGFRPG